MSNEIEMFREGWKMVEVGWNMSMMWLIVAVLDITKTLFKVVETFHLMLCLQL